MAVAHDAGRFEAKVDPARVSLFEAFPNEEEDRNRLISFLVSNKMQVSSLIQNQPFMLKPRVDQPRNDSKSGEERSHDHNSDNNDPARLQMLQQKVRILIESPLYFAGDLFDNNLVADEARILQLVHRQFGVYSLIRASQINMRKSLGSKLEQKRVGLSYCTTGIYMQNYSDFVVVPQTSIKKPVELLDADDLASAINTKLLNSETAVSLRDFVSKHEWDAYRDFEVQW